MMTLEEYNAAMRMYGLATSFPDQGTVFTLCHYNPEHVGGWELLVRPIKWMPDSIHDKSIRYIQITLDVGLLLWRSAGVMQVETSVDNLHEIIGEVLTAVYNRDPWNILDKYTWTMDETVRGLIDGLRRYHE